jgi:imidazolonepropionase-like amidohydrolase
MPGLIDVHAHMWHSSITPTQSWLYLANLAFGVTTTHDPSNPTETVFTNAEMVRAGALVGPRVFSTGTILYGAEATFKAVIDARRRAPYLRRMKAVGAFSVKSYNQPRRTSASKSSGHAGEMMVVLEGGSFFYRNCDDSTATRGSSTPSRSRPSTGRRPWGRSKTGRHTLVVGYGGLWGENTGTRRPTCGRTNAS